jgi:hypothetical protein
VASRGGSLDLSDGEGRMVLMLDDMLPWGREMINRCGWRVCTRAVSIVSLGK